MAPRRAVSSSWRYKPWSRCRREPSCWGIEFWHLWDGLEGAATRPSGGPAPDRATGQETAGPRSATGSGGGGGLATQPVGPPDPSGSAGGRRRQRTVADLHLPGGAGAFAVPVHHAAVARRRSSAALWAALECGDRPAIAQACVALAPIELPECGDDGERTGVGHGGLQPGTSGDVAGGRARWGSAPPTQF